MLANCFNYLGMRKVIFVQSISYSIKFAADLGKEGM